MLQYVLDCYKSIHTIAGELRREVIPQPISELPETAYEWRISDLAQLQGDAAVALKALQNGEDVMAAVHGESGGIVDDSDRVIHEGDIDPLDTDSTLDSLMGNTEEEGNNSDLSTDDESSAGGDGDDGQSDDLPTTETISVSDESGRRKVKIDFSNREAIRQAYRQAAGMRKYQKERDQARSQLKRLGGEEKVEAYLETQENWDRLEQVYERDGVRGVVNYLEDGGYEKLREEIASDLEWRRTASPEEVTERDGQLREQRLQRELEQERRAREDFQKKIESERDSAELAAAEAQVLPVFEKYRFAGKLGNADNEHDFDTALFDGAKSDLVRWEEEGIPITRELIDRAFRSRAERLRKAISTQVRKQTKRKVDKKKKEATENAQNSAMRGFKKNSAAKEVQELLANDNGSGLKAILSGWNKKGYGKVFGS